MGHVAAEPGSILIVRTQPVCGEEPPLCQGRVETRRGVAFAQDEAVTLRPVRPLGVHPQDLSIEYGKEVGDRKDGTNVGTASAMGHVEGVGPNPGGEGGEFGYVHGLIR